MKYRGNKICLDEQTNKWTNVVDRQLKNVMPSSTVSDSKDIKRDITVLKLTKTFNNS